MKKYEKIIKNLQRIDKESYEVFEKKLTYTPGSDEWKELEATENAYDELAEQELEVLKKTINWYRQRAKTTEDYELVEELEEAYTKLYDHLICNLTDEEIDAQATEAVKGIFEANGIDTALLKDKSQTEPNVNMDNDKMTADQAYSALNEMFQERGCRLDIVECINGVLQKGLTLNKTCAHYVSDELTRLSYEIPFQRMMGDIEERQRAINQKAAFELVLELSAAAEQRVKSQPDTETIKIFTMKLVLSQIERDSVKPHEIERIKQNLEDERQELIFVECLFGEETHQYKAILNEITEWEKLLAAALSTA